MKLQRKKQLAAAMGAFLLMFSSGIVTNTTTYFISAVTKELSWTRAVFTSYYSIIFVCTVAVSPFIGHLMPKLGYRKGFLIGTFGVGVGYLILSQLKGLGMLYLGAACIGIFQPFVIIPPVALVNTWFPNKNGFVMGFVMAGSGAAGITAAQVLPRVIEVVSWRYGYLFCGLCWVLCTLAANLLVGGSRPPQGSTPTSQAPRAGNSVYLSVGFMMFLLCCFMKHISSAFNQHFSTCLTDYYPTEQVITLMTLMNILLVTFKMTVGIIYDKVGARFVLLLLLPLGALGHLGIASSNFPLSVLCCTLIAICFCAETVVYPLLLRQLYDLDFASVAWGICRSAALLGNAVGAPLWGAVYDHTGSYRPALYIVPVVVIAICLYQAYRLKQVQK